MPFGVGAGEGDARCHLTACFIAHPPLSGVSGSELIGAVKPVRVQAARLSYRQNRYGERFPDQGRSKINRSPSGAGSD